MARLDDEDEETKIGPYAGISFDKKIVSQISTTFNIRRTLVLHLLTEYFEDNFLYLETLLEIY